MHAAAALTVKCGMLQHVLHEIAYTYMLFIYGVSGCKKKNGYFLQRQFTYLGWPLMVAVNCAHARTCAILARPVLRPQNVPVVLVCGSG